MKTRLLNKNLLNWCQEKLNCHQLLLNPLSGDAGFRSYYRINRATNSATLMLTDISNDSNYCNSLLEFLKVQAIFAQHNLRVPKIYFADLDKGWLIQEDLGNDLLLQVLQKDKAYHLYEIAVANIIRIQSISSPIFKAKFNNNFLDEQFMLFKNWFLKKHLHIDIKDSLIVMQALDTIKSYITKIPMVVAHLDFHAKNLMLLKQENALGIIDFQDACLAPYTYDLISLLQDAYISLPSEQVQNILNLYKKIIFKENLFNGRDFLKDYHWVGLQRHIKNLGIFCRLHYRDHKSNYLQFIPRLLHYIIQSSSNYIELQPLTMFMEQQILPKIESLSCMQ